MIVWAILYLLEQIELLKYIVLFKFLLFVFLRGLLLFNLFYSSKGWKAFRMYKKSWCQLRYSLSGSVVNHNACCTNLSKTKGEGCEQEGWTRNLCILKAEENTVSYAGVLLLFSFCLCSSVLKSWSSGGVFSSSPPLYFFFFLNT